MRKKIKGEALFLPCFFLRLLFFLSFFLELREATVSSRISQKMDSGSLFEDFFKEDCCNFMKKKIEEKLRYLPSLFLSEIVFFNSSLVKTMLHFI